ncbi:chymotrypsin-like [Anoplophora glabripennis]|uniref:chymotrypsin-like n=1 Tax=Anoplophora glabripennis TaxID=217634 RepID=UPI0008747983|nr:chymotrypsin-like [Anoplophora glabripennis]
MGRYNQAQMYVEPNLKWIESVIISYNQSTKDNPWYKQIVVEGSSICQLTGSKSACCGNAGAPLTLGDVQIGLAAYIPANCFREYPLVYTKVAKYVEWIKENSDI